ncbi:MAG: hypothetical protein JJE48_08230, partial [Actinobacteria bacterium]|nr:hypothetical protein [Actinomycetota bacterium]
MLKATGRKRAVATETGKATAGERIQRMQRRYQRGEAFISVERARYYTESWRATEGSGMALPVRVALAMKRVYENMTHYLDRDDRIAGYWTEYFLGMPIDIERGVFNRVLAAELTKSSMVFHRLKSLVSAFLYVLRKKQLREFLRNMRMTSRHGPRSLNLRLETMHEREINPFQIRKEDRRDLLRKLLPYWRERTTVDVLVKELKEAGLLSPQMTELTDSTTGNTSRQVLMLSPSATISTYQGHVILDYRKVLEKGLLAMKAEMEERLTAAAGGEERDFLQSVSIALDGVIVFARRLAERIEKELQSETGERKAELNRMREICRKVPLEPAESFREAVQSIWTVKVAVELAHPVNLHCFGRLDQDLYPYYKRDIEEGRTTPDAARELLEELLLKVMSLNMRPESNILGNFYH